MRSHRAVCLCVDCPAGSRSAQSKISNLHSKPMWNFWCLFQQHISWSQVTVQDLFAVQVIYSTCNFQSNCQNGSEPGFPSGLWDFCSEPTPVNCILQQPGCVKHEGMFASKDNKVQLLGRNIGFDTTDSMTRRNLFLAYTSSTLRSKKIWEPKPTWSSDS